jgi:serine/threonine-protein kinase RsbW
VHKVEGFLNKVNETLHLDEIQMNKVMISLTEAVNNAIIHGNGSDPQKRVHITCQLLPGWALFLIQDEGKGFDPARLENPLKGENLLRDSGRGVFLMKTLMDKVEFEVNDPGLLVRLWLNVNK